MILNVGPGKTSTQSTSYRFLFWLLIALPLYLYASLFALTGIPFLLEGDQTFFWMYALRMLHGNHIYRDFFQFTPPGVDLFFLTLYKLFGPHIWVMNFAVLLLGIALCWMCFYLAKQFMSPDMALLTTLLFTVLIYGSRLDATHHWFSMLAAMITVHVLLPKRSAARVAAAGAILGIASFFTQTAGAAGAIAIMATLAWEHDSEHMPWRTILARQALLLLTFALSWGVLSAHFIASVGWKHFWYYQITYPREYVCTATNSCSRTFEGSSRCAPCRN